MALIAKRSILWRGRLYNPGEELPAAPADMIQAWKKCGSVEDPAEQKMLTGHLDMEQLMAMKKPELEQLAADMGIELTAGETKQQIAEKIAQEEVEFPADETGTGTDE